MPADVWTLDSLSKKIRDDLEHHSEILVGPDELTRFINDAIDDAEETIVDAFSDFFLTYVDTAVTVGDTELTLPTDLYEMRIRGLYYDENEFGQEATSAQQWYKIKKVPLEEITEIYNNDDYHYRITNDRTLGLKIQIFPDIRDTTTARFRIYYIRRAARLENGSDVLEAGLRPQYIISHTKAAMYLKDGDPMYQVESGKTQVQLKKLMDSISRLTDDKEDEYLFPDSHALAEAYGEPFSYY